MITLHGQGVRVLDADVRDRVATVQWEGSGRVRLVSMLSLHGTEGGDCEVVRVCQEAEARGMILEMGDRAVRSNPFTASLVRGTGHHHGRRAA